MSSLYSVIPGLVPSQDEVIEAELLAKQILEGKFPDLDLREGTGLRDLVLRPTAYAFALLRKASDYYFAQNTLRGVDDTTPTEIVDDILSNWFLTRSTGTYAVISARLYFARQKNVTLTTDVSFSPDNALQYFPQQSRVYGASAMTYDSYNNEWYLDIDLQAASPGVEYNVGQGSLLYFTNFDPYFLRAEINYLAEESTPAETNSEFISRAASAISTRNLINTPSIDNRIRDVFNYVNRIVSVGAGDVDMIRDMIRVVFDDQTPTQTLTTSISGQQVTFTVQTHDYEVGQRLVVSDAVPESFNGQFPVVDVSINSVTLLIPGNPGYISTLPTLARAQEPVFVHNGGMVDVYCGERLETRIVQVTTDSTGTATIEGPVFALKRSEVSGGSDDDTIPVSKIAGPETYAVNNALRRITMASPAPGFAWGEAVTIDGLSQSSSISSITCAGLTVTASVSGHGAAVGSKVTVSGVTPGSYNGTFVVTAVGSNWVQYEVQSQISSAGTGSAKVLANASLTEGVTVVSQPLNPLAVWVPYLWVDQPVTGDLTISAPVGYVIRNPYTRPLQSATAVVNNGIVDVLLSNHGCELGRMVTLSSSYDTRLDGSWRITSSEGPDKFTIHVPALENVVGSIGSTQVAYVDHRHDYGFSPRQVLKVDFGTAYANATASFELSSFRDVSSVQEYLESPENRVLCGDLLARGFNLYMLDVDVVSYSGTAPSEVKIQSTIESHLRAKQPGDSLVLSDVVSDLNDAGITSIRTPIGIKYTRYNRDLTPAETGMITDRLDPQDKTSIFLLQSVTSSSDLS